MKNVFVFCLSIGIWLVSFSLSAQEITVRVVSGEESLEFAYLFINGAFYGGADSTGTARIPASRLQPGDTISAGYVGMKDGFAVYSGNQTVEVELVPDNVIEEIVVTSGDRSKEFFRQYVKKSYLHSWNTEYRGEYYLSFSNSSPAQGKYSMIITPPGIMDYFEIPHITLEPASDTTGRSRFIQGLIPQAWGMANIAAAVKSMYDVTKGMIVRYRGKDAGRHVFLIIKPYLDDAVGISDSFQTLLYVDEESGLIVSSETLVQMKGSTWRVSSVYSLRQKRGGPDRLYSVSMDGSVEFVNQERESVSFFIDRITVHDYSPPRIPRRDRKNMGNIYTRD